MANYLKEFKLTAQYEEYINSDSVLLPNVSLIKNNNTVYYNPVPNYLKFTAETDGSTISLNSATDPDIKYSLNGGDWIKWNYSPITLNTGDTVRMKGNNSNGFSIFVEDEYEYYGDQFIMSGTIAASGNIMSLLYEDNFEGKLTIPCEYCFYNMFNSCSSLTTVPELPATTLTNSCYSNMFWNCTSLTTAPVLPAETLAAWCYSSMFQDCTGLTTAPELPAKTLAAFCYYYMFNGCTSIKTAPELSATTLARYCYTEMFDGCSALSSITMLATDISAPGCLEGWVYNVASTGTFIKHPNMTSLPTGISGIPNGWTVQDAA